jgi:hypothetical protein
VSEETGRNRAAASEQSTRAGATRTCGTHGRRQDLLPLALLVEVAERRESRTISTDTVLWLRAIEPLRELLRERVDELLTAFPMFGLFAPTLNKGTPFRESSEAGDLVRDWRDTSRGALVQLGWPNSPPYPCTSMQSVFYNPSGKICLGATDVSHA